MTSRSIVLVVSLFLSFIWIAIGSFFLSGLNERMGILLFDFKSFPFTIQNLMWIIFFIGCGELFLRYQAVQQNRNALQANYLIENPRIFLGNEELIQIRKTIHDKNDILAALIKSLITRFQVSQQSVEETHQMLNTQLELMQYKVDINYNMIRFIVWLIPTLGFIGTVLGIANTLAAAGEKGAAEKPDFLHILTTNLALAFNTTLVALVMSSILVYIMHVILESEEKMIQRSGEYCLNFFINKLISK